MKIENVEKIKWREYITFKEDPEPEDVNVFNEYFKDFAHPSEKCIGCGNKFEGGVLGAFLGGMEGNTSIEWGIQNGEAYCVKCKWPYRGHHRNVGPINYINNWFLAYHPSVVKIEKGQADEQ